MNAETLQAAIDDYDSGTRGVLTMAIILKAARLVANPNIEAAQLVKIGDPCDIDGERDQVNEWITPRDLQSIIVAALTPSENDKD